MSFRFSKKRDSLLKCYFSSNIWAPSKKPLLMLLSLWCSRCPCPHSLCACRHHGNPGNQAETTETSSNPGNQAETTETSRKPRKTQETRQKQQKQAENPGKSRKTQEPSRKKKNCNSIESFKYEQSVFCLPSYPPYPPPPAR